MQAHVSLKSSKFQRKRRYHTIGFTAAFAFNGSIYRFINSPVSLSFLFLSSLCISSWFYHDTSSSASAYQMELRDIEKYVYVNMAFLIYYFILYFIKSVSRKYGTIVSYIVCLRHEKMAKKLTEYKKLANIDLPLTIIFILSSAW